MGATAIVAGGGFGGLAAAAGLARSGRFAKVLVLDKDERGDGAAPRLGVGQGAHTHQLLASGEGALERLLPGFGAALLAAGGRRLRGGLDVKVYDFLGDVPDCDAGFSTTCLSRPLYERTLRDATAKLPGVELRFEAPVRRIVVENGRATAVETEDGQRLAADLIVDASGMNAPLVAQLVEDGHAAFDTEDLKINVAYVTGRVRQPAKYAGETLAFFTLPGPGGAGFGLMQPIENGEWIVSLGGRGANLPPRDLAGFREFASRYPTPDIFDRIRDAELVGDLKMFRKTTSTRRRLDQATKWPDRLVVVGDAASNVNPTYGQGMSVAALQGEALSTTLAASPDLDGFTKTYLAAAFEISRRAWSLAANSDLVYPETEGPRPPDFEVGRTMARVLRELAQHDADFRILRLRLGQLLEDGSSLRDGPLAIKFFTALQGSMAPPAT